MCNNKSVEADPRIKCDDCGENYTTRPQRKPAPSFRPAPAPSRRRYLVTLTVTVATDRAPFASVTTYVNVSVPTTFWGGVSTTMPPDVIETVPWLAARTAVTRIESPSGSLSLRRTLIVTDLPDFAVAVSSTATGARL